MDSGLIYDIGLHKGEDSEFYLKKGFRVVAVEAVPELCEIARNRLREYVDSGQLTIVNMAIAERRGPVKFFVNQMLSVWGTSRPDWAQYLEMTKGAKSVEIMVPGVPFKEVLHEFGVPYYLKIDLEGTDLLCLQGLSGTNNPPRYVSIESARDSWENLRKELSLFQALGYKRFKIVQQLDISEQVCPSPAREGRYVEQRFELGSSGLFGEELPGNWLSEQQATKRFRRIFLKEKLLGDRGICWRWRLGRSVVGRLRPKIGWYDTHASA